MSKRRTGSLGYQMLKALQGVFKPGSSRHRLKRSQREKEVITSIGSMQSLTADIFLFARFVRQHWSEVQRLEEVRPEMATALIAAQEQAGNSGGYIGRVMASLRKLDTACRQAGIFHPDAPPLLPYQDQGGPGGHHATPKPIPYTPEQAQAIIAWVAERDPDIARLLNLMWVAGLRVTEAVYLRADDIDLDWGEIHLNMVGNPNRTKGGRPRTVQYAPEHQAFMHSLKQGKHQPDGHLFAARRSLPDRARARVRQACRALELPCLGTHGFRKAFSVAQYRQARQEGASDRQALLHTSHQLGHNRIAVTYQSYVPPQERRRSSDDGEK
jgi:integrase